MKPTIGELPDIAKSLAKLKIVIDLRSKANEKTYLGKAIIQACDDKKNADKLISMILDYCKDDLHAVYSAIGEELTERILNF